jgi:hypothetical protein
VLVAYLLARHDDVLPSFQAEAHCAVDVEYRFQDVIFRYSYGSELDTEAYASFAAMAQDLQNRPESLEEVSDRHFVSPVE